MLDDAFRDDKEFANTWSPIRRDPQGKLTVEGAKPYSGLGGYMKMTELSEPPGAVCRMSHCLRRARGLVPRQELPAFEIAAGRTGQRASFRRKLGKGAGVGEDE